jgi:hypothetical protein
MARASVFRRWVVFTNFKGTPSWNMENTFDRHLSQIIGNVGEKWWSAANGL